MLAYKRLQKPDVIFGHPERTAKVAFAEPLREPDPEVMAQVLLQMHPSAPVVCSCSELTCSFPNGDPFDTG